MAKTAPLAEISHVLRSLAKFGGSVTAQNFRSPAWRRWGAGAAAAGKSGFSFLGVVSLELVALSPIKSSPQIQCC